MKKVFGIGLFALLLAACGDSHKPGSKSTVTAYEPDGKTVIQLEDCNKLGRTYDYVSCGNKLRASVNASLCARGGGNHPWLYQIGASSPMSQQAYCR